MRVRNDENSIIIIIFFVLLQSTTIILCFSTSSCSNIRQHSTSLSIYNRDYYDRFHRPPPPHPFRLWNVNSYIMRPPPVSNGHLNHPNRFRFQNHNTIPIPRAHLGGRGRFNTFNLNNERINNTRRLKHQDNVITRGGVRQPNQFSRNNGWNNHANRQHPQPSHRRFDNTTPSSPLISAPYSQNKQRYSTNNDLFRRMDNQQRLHQRQNHPQSNSRFQQKQGYTKYNDVLRRMNNYSFEQKPPQKRIRNIMDPVQRNWNDSSLRYGSDQNFYANNMSSNKRRVANTNPVINNYPSRNIRSNTRNNNHHTSNEKPIPSSNPYNRQVDSVQNKRRSMGMVDQGYVDTIKSRKYSQNNNNDYTKQHQQHNVYYQSDASDYNSFNNEAGFNNPNHNNQEAHGNSYQGNNPAFYQNKNENYNQEIHDDSIYDDNDHISEFIDEDNNSNTYDKKYIRTFENDILSRLSMIEEKLHDLVTQPQNKVSSRSNSYTKQSATTTSNRYDNDTVNRQWLRSPYSNMRNSSLRDKNDRYVRTLRTKRDNANKNFQKKRVLENRMDEMEQRLNAFYGRSR